MALGLIGRSAAMQLSAASTINSLFVVWLTQDAPLIGQATSSWFEIDISSHRPLTPILNWSPLTFALASHEGVQGFFRSVF
jgi:hypothetical protein